MTKSTTCNYSIRVGRYTLAGCYHCLVNHLTCYIPFYENYIHIKLMHSFIAISHNISIVLVV